MNNPEKLYVKFKRPKSLKEFIIKYYDLDRPEKHPSYFYGPSTNTYNDIECTTLHCNKYCRSWDDLYIIFKTYYPSLSKAKCFDTLMKTCLHKGYKFQLAYCGGMKRIRFIPGITWRNYSFSNICLNHLNTKMSNSKNTWKELFNLLKLDTDKKILEYLNKNYKNE